VLRDGINGKPMRGSVFCRDGKVIVRTGAKLFDAYTAYKAAARAVDGIQRGCGYGVLAAIHGFTAGLTAIKNQ
jgi:hypothetical protein